MGQGQEVKIRNDRQVEIQERGEIFYRPKSGERPVEEKQDPQSGKEGSNPDSSDKAIAEGGHGSQEVNIEKQALLRLTVRRKKSLPDPSKRSRPQWGFVEMVTSKIDDINVGEGEAHTHLIYKLEFPPEDEKQEPQESLNVDKEGSFLIHIKNPDQQGAGPSQFRGLQNKRKAVFPARLQGQFGQLRYSPADPPDFPNYEWRELLLISASNDIEEELGSELKPEGEADPSCSDLLKMFRETAPADALLKCFWV
ncbi:hypothetical protein EUGRSUZ_E02162 [Eucalyptus grandis]|uniref:Uncharacterized protein n=2 Tax=Eucalyptus grandis TaxID=71139 RepID=A0ACC3KWX9_EUCGR|nr:hypothetical protein EUGRSUZ_E02162 [Eucalyptus grandis]